MNKVLQKVINIFGGAKSTPEAIIQLHREQTANELINVRNINYTVLYSKDGYIYAYIKIEPFSLDLLSNSEEAKKVRDLSAQFAAEKKPVMFHTSSRPVDISRQAARLTQLLETSDNPIQRDLLKRELRNINSVAQSGRITERLSYMILWEKITGDGERELMKRACECVNRFSACGILSEVCQENGVIRFLNLFANPMYAHLEDENITPTTPLISTVKK